MGIAEITAFVVAVTPIAVQIIRLLEGKIQADKYYRMRESIKDICRTVEETSKTHPEHYSKTGKLRTAQDMARSRWPKEPASVTQTLVIAVLPELGYGAAFKEKENGN